jgi:hypothetical protein
MYRRSKSARLLGEQEAWEEEERKKKEFEEEFYRSGRRRRQKARENARWASGDERGASSTTKTKQASKTHSSGD